MNYLQLIFQCNIIQLILDTEKHPEMLVKINKVNDALRFEAR